VPLSWETPSPGLGPTLGCDADGVLVARVRKVGNAWHGWYDAGGLGRPPRAPFGPDEAGFPLGTWASPGEALAAVGCCHDRNDPRRRPNHGYAAPSVAASELVQAHDGAVIGDAR
jgi:hypothetical protein